MTKKRNPVAKELNEDRDGEFRLRIVEPKRRSHKKLKPHVISGMDEEDLEDLYDE